MGGDKDARGNRVGRKVSIHAPAWGATLGAGALRMKHLVSIHAPAWGATRRPGTDEQEPFGFNPRPRMGGDG